MSSEIEQKIQELQTKYDNYTEEIERSKTLNKLPMVITHLTRRQIAVKNDIDRLRKLL
jgi:hypothetical protein